LLELPGGLSDRALRDDGRGADMRLFLILLFAFNLAAAPAMADPGTGSSPATMTSTDAGTAAKAAADAAKKAKDAKALEAKRVADKAAADAKAEADRQTRFWEAIAGFAVTVIAIGVFAWKSDVLRDSDPVDFPGATIAGTPYPAITVKRTFSLAQSQMLWWFGVVISSSVYFTIYYHEIGGGLNEQALILTGIGAATAVGSAIIEQSRQNKGKALDQYNNAMQALLTAATPGAPTMPVATASGLYQEMLHSLAALKSDGFISDILSDANGVSMHRFQSAAWTVVLGATYLVNVFWPEAGQLTKDGTTVLPLLTGLQLGLLGISNGTYLGLKIPEATPSAKEP
jgi:hypothetical protein